MMRSGPADDPGARPSRRRFLRFAAALPLGTLPAHARETEAGAPPGRSGRPALRRILRVGPGRDLITPSMAAAVARDGDQIDIEAGEYPGDFAVWTRDRLLIRGVGGAARLIAAGASAEGKAIWVMRGGRATLENLEFRGARVAARNGAGIRLERGHLTVRDCVFADNENGILTANDREIELDIERCEFGHNGHGDGYSHNLYAGLIKRLTVSASYFHHARVGHLLKSRAAENIVRHNRLTDEAGGSASYELEFPAGGVAWVEGNLIAQSEGTENPVMVSFGAEGYAWPRNELMLAHNTLVDLRRRDGVFLAVRSGPRKVTALNNLLLGESRLETAGEGEYRGNLRARGDDFVDVPRFDLRLRARSPLAGKVVAGAGSDAINGATASEYRHPRQLRRLRPGTALQPGAMQTLGTP